MERRAFGFRFMDEDCWRRHQEKIDATVAATVAYEKKRKAEKIQRYHYFSKVLRVSIGVTLATFAIGVAVDINICLLAVIPALFAFDAYHSIPDPCVCGVVH